MTNVIGLSAFGLRDCISEDGVIRFERQFHLSQALLPASPSDQIMTGKRAEGNRTHTGLPWPLESQIPSNKPLRRAPISYIWRALVEAGDRMGRWNIGRGISFPLAKIIAVYTADMIKEQAEGYNDNQPVLSIPNHLDEYGQEFLLRELSACGYGKTMLLWRPVAVALSWLEKVEGDFFHKKMNPDEHIHVVYLGTDAIELTTLRLRPWKHNGLVYILPLRERPKDIPESTGFDWAGRLIESLAHSMDKGAFWQIFSIFPEVWEAIAGKVADITPPFRPWSYSGNWTLWNAPPDLRENVLRVTKGPCSTLRKILDSSCKLSPINKDEHPETINHFLQDRIAKMAEMLPNGALRGMIITGPLAGAGIPLWLKANIDALKKRGLKCNGDLSNPELDNLWLCAQCNDPVANGAAIYGRRILAEIPAYLDTMPQVSILAKEKSRFTWVPLLNAQEVLGGQEHTDKICGKFQLGRGLNKLDAYLYKGPVEEADSIMEKVSNPMAVPHGTIPPCRARLVRHVVRQLGSLERVRKNQFFMDGGKIAAYGVAFAKSLYSDEAEALDDTQLKQSSFRLARINFLSSPPKDMILDIEVRMRPASGLAKVEILPEQTEFLHGRKVRLDYGKMRPPKRLPSYKRGWPGIQELIVDPEDENLRGSELLVSRFEDTPPSAANYSRMINLIRDSVLKGARQKHFLGDWFFVQSLDQNGRACSAAGNDILERISEKIKKDFHYFELTNQQSMKNMIFSRATWLYWKTPSIVVEHIKKIMKEDYTMIEWCWAVDSASRCFQGVNEYHDLFQSIAWRIKKPYQVQPFPIQSARGIWRILMIRADGEQALDRTLARLFAKAALKRLYEGQKNNKYDRLYFQLIRFLLYLLRYRKTDPACFDPNDFASMEVFEQALVSMNEAKKFCLKNRDFLKAKKIQRIANGFERYLQYEGSENLLTLLSEEAGGVD